MTHAHSPSSDTDPTAAVAPTPDDIREARARLGDRVRLTPVWEWRSDAVRATLGDAARVLLKLELFQYGGSFKPRGALTVMTRLAPDALARGVTAMSAGNHAIAVAYAARVLGTTAKVVVPRTASPVRVARAQAFGAEVVLVDDVHAAFAVVREIEATEGRAFVHPFEGPLTTLGTATVGMELLDQTATLGATLDAVLVPVGGGGLIAGIAAAIKQMHPGCAVYGIEPEGADTMARSFRSGHVESIDRVRTIADSLGAPYTAPYSLALCRRYVDEIVLVSDEAMRDAMRLLFDEMKLACEPAGAAATAALWGPLHERLQGRTVGVIVCGSNIDQGTFCRLIDRS